MRAWRPKEATSFPDKPGSSLPSLVPLPHYLFYEEANEKLDRYVARLNAIDYASFAREILAFRDINIRLEGSRTEKEMNLVLHEVMRERKILLPYEDLCGLDAFMNDKNTTLVI